MSCCLVSIYGHIHVLSLLPKSLVCVSNFTLMCLEMEIFGFILFAQLLDSVDLCFSPNLGYVKPLFLQIISSVGLPWQEG